jgi:hypothetical protein
MKHPIVAHHSIRDLYVIAGLVKFMTMRLVRIIVTAALLGHSWCRHAVPPLPQIVPPSGIWYSNALLDSRVHLANRTL